MDNMVNSLGTKIFTTSGNSRISAKEGIMSKFNGRGGKPEALLAQHFVMKQSVLSRERGPDRD